MRPLFAGAILAGALVALTGEARAQTDSTYTETRTDEGQDVRFRDDPMSGLTHGTIGTQFTGFHPPKRFQLLRPRTTFVPQMLKTVENM